MKKKTQKGFTLLEILLVVALIAVLASIVLVAIKPATRLRETNDTQRKSDVASILSAVYQYAIDNSGSLPDDSDGETIDTNNKILGESDADCSGLTCPAVTTNADCIDLSSDLVDTGGYLSSIPINPGVGSNSYDADNTGYYITQAANGVITVGSCEDDINGDDILTSR